MSKWLVAFFAFLCHGPRLLPEVTPAPDKMFQPGLTIANVYKQIPGGKGCPFADRGQLFQRVCENFPVFAEYQARTERVIPVVELLREPAD